MLSTTTTLPTTIILDLPKDNWSTWHQALNLLCFTKFGVAGQQILSDTLVSLQPLATEPIKLDLDLDLAGAPIPGQLTYSRRSLTAEEAALPPIDPATLPLSTQGNTNYRDDRKIFTDAKRRFSDHDTECPDHLYRHLTPASHTSIKTHTLPTSYFPSALEAMPTTSWRVASTPQVTTLQSSTEPANT